MHGLDEPLHFLNGIADQNRLEIISVPQAVANAASDGVDILQNRGVLRAVDVVGHLGAQVRARQHVRHVPGGLRALRGNGQVTEALQSHFFCVAGSHNYPEVFVINSVGVVHELTHNLVAVGHNSLDGGKHFFPFQGNVQVFQGGFQKRRRHGQHNNICIFHHGIQVRINRQVFRIELNIREVARIVVETLDVQGRLRIPNPPAHVLVVVGQQFDERGGKATAANDGYTGRFGTQNTTSLAKRSPFRTNTTLAF